MVKLINKEKYREQIINTSLHQFDFGINNETGRLFDCSETQDCEHCRFNAADYCSESRKVWLGLESDSDTSDMDLNPIPIDTLIHITNKDGFTIARHFAGLIGGKVTYFADRRNSSDFKAIYPVEESETVKLEPDKGM